MKNYLLLFFLTITLSVGAQQLVFDITEFAVEPNSQDQIGELFDEFYTDKKFKSGGVVLERLEHGSREGKTHRYVRMWELGKWGMEEDVDKYEGRAFWSRLRNFVDTSVKSERYSGRILSWKEGDTTKTPYVHIWDIKPSDPVAFKKAHDKLVEDAAEAFTDRTVGFGTYDVNQQNGASHWVVVTGSNVGDHLNFLHEIETKYSKDLTKWYESRGEVENIRDFMLQILKRY